MTVQVAFDSKRDLYRRVSMATGLWLPSIAVHKIEWTTPPKVHVSGCRRDTDGS